MISTPKISLRGLRTFCVAARYESFRTAGKMLFITASAVSHQIKGLEEELGGPLFDRNGRTLSLTEKGQSLYDDLSPLMEQLGKVVAQHSSGDVSGSIRISVQPFFASEYFIPRLNEFTAEYPEIDIQVGTSDESSQKHPSDADLSIRLFRSPPADMPSNMLFPLRLMPGSSPEFKKSITVKNKKITSEFPLIVHETFPKAWAEWSKSSGIKLPDNPKVLRFDSMIAAIRAAQQGLGAALVPVPIGNLWFEEGSVVKLFEKQLVADLKYFLVCSEDRATEESVQLFRDWIVTKFTQKA